MAIDQSYIDEVLASWHKSQGSIALNPDAILLFESLIPAAELCLKFLEAVSYTFLPHHAEHLEAYGVEEDRIVELSQGAEPTNEEVAIWTERVWIGQTDFVEVVEVYKLSGSDSKSAFFYISYESCSGLDQACYGPYFEIESLATHLAEKVQDWDAWWVALVKPDFDRLVKLIEQQSGKFEQGGA